MNYKNMLRAYIQVVVEHESVAFLPGYEPLYESLSPQERAEIERIGAEFELEYRKKAKETFRSCGQPGGSTTSERSWAPPEASPLPTWRSPKRSARRRRRRPLGGDAMKIAKTIGTTPGTFASLLSIRNALEIAASQYELDARTNGDNPRLQQQFAYQEQRAREMLTFLEDATALSAIFE